MSTQETIDAIAKIAAHNLARDLASATGATPDAIASRYVIEAFKSLEVGGMEYQVGQLKFIDNFIAEIVGQFLGQEPPLS